MKVVDKHELAKMPNGTPFYALDEYGNIGNCGDNGLMILDSIRTIEDTFDDERGFNGVVYLEPAFNNFDIVLGIEFTESQFTEDQLPDKFELFASDTASADFTDDDRFLVLDKEELGIIIDFLKKCYEKI